jgi:hypothetical protein
MLYLASTISNSKDGNGASPVMTKDNLQTCSDPLAQFLARLRFLLGRSGDIEGRIVRLIIPNDVGGIREDRLEKES